VAAEEDAGMFGFERSLDNDRVLVVLNVSDTATSHTELGGMVMPTGFPPGTVLHAQFPPDANDTVTVDASGGVVVSLPPRGVRVFTP
jgi:hypothetical protein